MLMSYMFFLIMKAEQIFSEIIFKVAPDGVYVVCTVLGIVILHQEKKPVEAVVVGCSAILPAGPGKVNRIQTDFIQLF